MTRREKGIIVRALLIPLQTLAIILAQGPVSMWIIAFGTGMMVLSFGLQIAVD